LAAPAIDPDHLSSVAGSKSELLKSYRVTPPIQPWPERLHPRRLAAMIRRQPDHDLAVRIFLHAEAFHPGFSHTYLTYHALLDRLARARAFPQLESILSHLRRRCAGSPGDERPFRCGEEAFITVIRSYGLAGKPSAALRTFLSIRRDFGVAVSVRAFNALLNAMIQNRRNDLVAVLFKNCRSKFGVLPNVFTCNILIKALCKMGNVEGAVQMLDEMPTWGMVPNIVSYTTVLGGYCARGDLDGARRLFGEILDHGWAPDATTYTVLMEGYCSQNRLLDAVKVMDEMTENGVAPNDVTYSVIIEAYCKAKRSGEALNLLHDMLDAKYMPSPTLCCKVIDVLCEDGRVEDACDAWKKLLKKNCTPDNAISSTLIYWLCKKGKVWEARKLFGQFEKGFIPSALTYNTLISGMCENGELQEAGRLWDDMEAKRCPPNAFTYNVLIKGFCNAGKAKEAVRFLKEMMEKGCLPDKFTYSALVDGLYESGDKEEVSEVLHLVASCECQFLNEECWDVFVRKVVVDSAGSCGSSLEQVMQCTVA
ncbi:hypothetical protein Taro_028968, partial [Colocasia esculenta]|nr:hypothetical protein [Colocasia esculenta]